MPMKYLLPLCLFLASCSTTDDIWPDELEIKKDFDEELNGAGYGVGLKWDLSQPSSWGKKGQEPD